MTKENLFPAWGILYIICAGLSFIPDSSVSIQALKTIFSIAFFVPPMLLLYRASRENDRKDLLLLRRISAASLGLTLLLIIITILNALRQDAFTVLLNILLTLVSMPMLVCRWWALSLFLWACLLVGSFRKPEKKK